MGSTLSGILGTNNDYQATNPYSGADFQTALQNQKNVFNSEWAQSNSIYDNFQSPNAVNPAQAQYIQNTQNLAQQQATQNAQNRAMNPGAAARLSGQQAVAGGQQAAGQASINQMNQMAMGQEMQNNLLATMGGQAYNQAANIAQNQQAVNGINSGVAAGNQAQNGKIVGGLMNAAGAAATGGMSALAPAAMGAMSGGGGAPVPMSGPNLGVNYNLMGAAKGGFIGELMKQGGRVPGQAKVPGDSPKNDTVHAMLSPDELVVKRSAATSREKAKAFIDHLFDHMEKEKGSSQDDDDNMSFGKVLAARKTASEYSKKAKKKD